MKIDLIKVARERRIAALGVARGRQSEMTALYKTCALSNAPDKRIHNFFVSSRDENAPQGVIA